MPEGWARKEAEYKTNISMEEARKKKGWNASI